MQDIIRNFVENGIDKEPRKMRSSLFLANFFPLIGVLYGVLLGNLFIAFSAVIIFLLLGSYILIIVFTRNVSIYNTIKANICFNMCTACCYFLFAMILYAMYSGINSKLLLLFLPELLIMLITIVLVKQSLKKVNAKSHIKRNISIGSVAGITAVITFFALKRFNVNIEQSVALIIGTVLLMLLSSVFVILMTISVMKLHYIRKYNIAFDG